jgi:hypothetical protein
MMDLENTTVSIKKISRKYSGVLKTALSQYP